MFENGSAEMNFAHFFLLEHPKVNLQVVLLLKGQVIQAGMLENVCNLYYKNGWKDVPGKWHRVSLDFTSAGSGLTAIPIYSSLFNMVPIIHCSFCCSWYMKVKAALVGLPPLLTVSLMLI